MISWALIFSFTFLLCTPTINLKLDEYSGMIKKAEAIDKVTPAPAPTSEITASTILSKVTDPSVMPASIIILETADKVTTGTTTPICIEIYHSDKWTVSTKLNVTIKNKDGKSVWEWVGIPAEGPSDTATDGTATQMLFTFKLLWDTRDTNQTAFVPVGDYTVTVDYSFSNSNNEYVSISDPKMWDANLPTRQISVVNDVVSLDNSGWGVKSWAHYNTTNNSGDSTTALSLLVCKNASECKSRKGESDMASVKYTPTVNSTTGTDTSTSSNQCPIFNLTSMPIAGFLTCIVESWLFNVAQAIYGWAISLLEQAI